MCFLSISGEVEIDTKKYGKTQIFRIYGFLKYFG